MTIKTKFLAVVPLAAILAFTPTAQAQDANGSMIVTGSTMFVSFADLNLNSDRGVDILDRRIRHAAEQVCGGQPQGNLLFGGPMRQCQRETLAACRPARDRAIAAVRNGDTTRMATTITIRREG